MSSLRALRSVYAGARPSLSATHRRQRPRVTSMQQMRCVASKGKGEKDDLGGPGGQEPVDPTARARQNARLRNTTTLAAAMVVICVPFFYMVGKPEKIAEKTVNQQRR
ncbi:hypothetical protein N0V93_008942 [Gnomoniopsis smithogilvyi]|uniref:Uncharacterized protein n=1 Tax=Gnomoniopsis smithogilvyi TaxID=1191159 RepID=A0A9W9CS88_9PEZI|nr:hypothetical protein N0V93_008942 [Gnomoniopsis smithogilvyi]